MYNKALDEIKGWNAFGYKIIILMPGIMDEILRSGTRTKLVSIESHTASRIFRSQ